jgi:hypothetical protein
MPFSGAKDTEMGAIEMGNTSIPHYKRLELLCPDALTTTSGRAAMLKVSREMGEEVDSVGTEPKDDNEAHFKSSGYLVNEKFLLTGAGL